MNRIESIKKGNAKKRNNYFGFLLLTIFIFCTVSSVFAINTSSISKQSYQQIAQHLPSDGNNQQAIAELNEEDFTHLDFNFAGFYLRNKICSFQSNYFISSFFSWNSSSFKHQHLHLFLAIRSIRI